MALFTCSTCSKPHNNPLKHVCRVKVSKTGAARVRRAQERKNSGKPK